MTTSTLGLNVSGSTSSQITKLQLNWVKWTSFTGKEVSQVVNISDHISYWPHTNHILTTGNREQAETLFTMSCGISIIYKNSRAWLQIRLDYRTMKFFNSKAIFRMAFSKIRFDYSKRFEMSSNFRNAKRNFDWHSLKFHSNFWT